RRGKMALRNVCRHAASRVPGPNVDLWRRRVLSIYAAYYNRARTQKTRPCIEPSNGPVSLSPLRFWPDCISKRPDMIFGKDTGFAEPVDQKMAQYRGRLWHSADAAGSVDDLLSAVGAGRPPCYLAAPVEKRHRRCRAHDIVHLSKSTSRRRTSTPL